MNFVGIDPGITGGIAIKSGISHQTFPMPLKRLKNGKRQLAPHDLDHIVKQFPPITLAVIEKVSSRPGQGVASVFTFGENFGMIQGILAANGIPFLPVLPQVWKGAFGLSRDKKDAIALANTLTPGMSFTAKQDGEAEAMLLAHYADIFLLALESLKEEPEK